MVHGRLWRYLALFRPRLPSMAHDLQNLIVLAQCILNEVDIFN